MSEPLSLRVLTWNLRSLLGDPLALVRVVRSAAPDVLCLQEGPRLPGSRNRLATLASRCGLFYVAGGRSAGGTAILASMRARAADVEAFRLPMPGRRSFPRGAVTATVSLAGSGPVRVACVHLPLDAERRLAHVEAIRYRLERPGVPAVVGGDLNERPGGRTWTALSHFLADPDPLAGPTFPSKAPRTRIDAVLTAGVDVTGYDTWRADPDDVRRASDHRPVLATLTLPSRA